jgi:hypothetical protein
MDITINNPAVLNDLGKNQNLSSRPAKINFGNMPKNTVPCDGIMVRDKGDVVDMCMKAELLEQRPKNYHVCPPLTTRTPHALRRQGRTLQTDRRLRQALYGCWSFVNDRVKDFKAFTSSYKACRVGYSCLVCFFLGLWVIAIYSLLGFIACFTSFGTILITRMDDASYLVYFNGSLQFAMP